MVFIRVSPSFFGDGPGFTPTLPLPGGPAHRGLGSARIPRAPDKYWKPILFYMVLRTWTIPEFHMSVLRGFKIIEITVEVSQKSTFQEMLKIAHEDSTLPKINIA